MTKTKSQNRVPHWARSDNPGPLQRRILQVLYAYAVLKSAEYGLPCFDTKRPADVGRYEFFSLNAGELARIISDFTGKKVHAASISGALSGMRRQASRYWIEHGPHDSWRITDKGAMTLPLGWKVRLPVTLATQVSN